MTQKDYIAFAGMLKDLRKTAVYDSEAFATVRVLEVAERLTNIFGNDNPRFDKNRFLKAVNGE